MAELSVWKINLGKEDNRVPFHICFLLEILLEYLN